MRKALITLSTLAMIFMMAGCGEDESGEETTTATSSEVSQGWHFQGRDCLACHNVDLQEPKHLVFGGTIYKEKSVINQDDLNSVCGGDFIINYLDNNSNVIYSSKDYIDVNSKGNKGKGNLFILKRELALISSGSYTIEVTTQDGTTMAKSGPTHNFTSQDYDINNPKDYANRVSCNACHINGGDQPPVYVNFTANNTLCQ